MTLTTDTVVLKVMALTDNEQIKADLNRRSLIGIEKYGTTLDKSGLTNVQFFDHAYEELLDAANYMQAIGLDPLASDLLEWAKACIATRHLILRLKTGNKEANQ